MGPPHAAGLVHVFAVSPVGSTVFGMSASGVQAGPASTTPASAPPELPVVPPVPAPDPPRPLPPRPLPPAPRPPDECALPAPADPSGPPSPGVGPLLACSSSLHAATSNVHTTRVSVECRSSMNEESPIEPE